MPISSFFTKTFTQRRPVTSADGLGGWTQTYSTVSSTLKGQLTPITGNENVQGEQFTYKQRYKFFCAAIEDVLRGDIITYDSTDYEIMVIRDPAQKSHHMEAICEEIQRE